MQSHWLSSLKIIQGRLFPSSLKGCMPFSVNDYSNLGSISHRPSLTAWNFFIENCDQITADGDNHVYYWQSIGSR